MAAEIAGWAQAGGSLLGSLFSGIFGNRATNKTNATNLQIARENNALQQQIAKENNQLQIDMMRENNKYSRDLALEMFNLENSYNTPAAQKQRLIDAGLNPATMYGGGQVANTGDVATPSSAGSTVSPSMPQFVTPTMQTPPTVLGTMFGSLESVTRSLTNLSQSDLNRTQKERIATLLSTELEKAMNESESVAINNQVKKFTFELDKVFAALERTNSLNKGANEAYKLYQEGLLAAVRQETEKADKLFKDAQTLLTKAESKKISELLPVLVQSQEETVKLLKEQQKTERAKQTHDYAGAELASESAETVRQVRDSEVAVRHYAAEHSKDTYIMFKTYLDKVYSAYSSQLDMVKLNRDLLEERIKAAIRDNDWGEVTNLINAVSGLTGSFADIRKALTPFKVGVFK